MTYKDEAIKGVLTLLESIEIHGIENAKRIVLIDQILRNPEGDNDGSKNEEI